MRLTVANDMAIGATYTVSWDWDNVNTPQNSLDYPITLSSDGHTTQSVDTEGGETILGIVNGSNFLKLVTFEMHGATAAQSSPLPGGSNTLTVSLFANMDLTAGSLVTVSGITGYLVDSAGPELQTYASGAGSFASTLTSWEPSAGAVVLTVGSSGMTKTSFFRSDRQAAVFALGVRNLNDVTNASLQLTINGVYERESGDLSSATASVEAVSEARYGLIGASVPGVVFRPETTLHAIDHRSPLVGSSNTITFSMSCTLIMPEGSKFTIRGLTGTQTSATAIGIPDRLCRILPFSLSGMTLCFVCV